jgi:hypothetical protein
VRRFVCRRILFTEGEHVRRLAPSMIPALLHHHTPHQVAHRMGPMKDRSLERQLERQQWMFRLSTAVVTALFAALILSTGDLSDLWALIPNLLIFGYFEYLHQRLRGRRPPPKS